MKLGEKVKEANNTVLNLNIGIKIINSVINIMRTVYKPTSESVMRNFMDICNLCSLCLGLNPIVRAVCLIMCLDDVMMSLGKKDYGVATKKAFPALWYNVVVPLLYMASPLLSVLLLTMMGVQSGLEMVKNGYSFFCE